ncbi:hypothetical protein [Flavobacterium urocaniciphilum]|uniref:Uncharacterized protein n=1 Tax=Flavobacterium urocaniciphilum TaxID=1299341 RepID=A0A1H9C822_9FLAO|nr:hypothetical protein [Flavobacterium urocaniciphilum]SEP97356.1 hypothetical protein SAMN05444005_10496 [Flavobacterium urocaniciphilum]
MNYNEDELDKSINLLKSIGFTDENKIKIILQEYENILGYIDYEYTTRERRNRKGQKTYSSYFQKVYKNDKIVEFLKLEFNLKKNNEIIKKENKNKKISATDLANYIYCPANYSISNSFNIEHSINQSKKSNGSKLHNELKLIYKKKKFGDIRNLHNNYFFDNKNIIKKISNCRLIYSGSDTNTKFYSNDNLNYIAKPDYIFLDPNNNFFVVEEKFHLYNSKSKKNDIKFYTNNLIQLQSYIEYINELDIKYGVLIDWSFTINKDEFILLGFKHKIIKKGNNKQLLEKTYNEILKLNNEKKIPFNKNVNILKCINCSVSIYCSHKTEKFEYLEFPYNIEHLKIVMNDNDNNNDCLPLAK